VPKRRDAQHLATPSTLRIAKAPAYRCQMWGSSGRVVPHDESSAPPIAPEICVEVRSPSTTDEEMAEKRALYFEAGADEVWICDADGTMHVFDAEGEMKASRRAPGFPARVEL
jgi:hypothetical protein